MSRFLRVALILVVALTSQLLGLTPATALEECRLMRMPDIQGDRIVFVYAGDLWTVARSGGTAQRLTSHEGLEVFPKLSPDGSTIAFTGEYDGNTDAYIIPATGGEPKRLTFHPGNDQVAEWYPDGRSLLLRSSRASNIQRYDRFFKIPAAGGYEELLKLPTAGYASLSADGGQIAFVSPSYDRRTWKRYRGGNAPNIWVYDFKANQSENITKDWAGPDEWPMFHGRTVYYVSDRGQGGKVANLWKYDLDKHEAKQVTTFTDYDVKWPSVGSDAIVFENGGWLWVLSLPGEQLTKLSVMVPDDKPATRAEFRSVADWMGGMDLSPSGKRAVIAARGELFSLPAEKGDVRNLTNTPGARERDPSWSPDGKWIAYWSDASGEYQLHVVGADGKGARQVTREPGTFRYALAWSPDSKKLAFADKTGRLHWCDVASGKVTQVDKNEYGEIRQYAWSPDSRWVAYAKTTGAGFNVIWLYSLSGNRTQAVTEGLSDDFSPSFDPEGRYLYFVSRRTFRPEFGGFELNMQFSATDKLYAMTLRDTLPSPVAPESDEESAEEAAKGDDKADKGGKSDKSEKSAKDDATRIDLEGLGSRVAELPVPAGRYPGLAGVKGKVVFLAQDGSPDEDGNAPLSIHYYDLEKREDKTVMSGVNGAFGLSKDGGKLLYRKDDTVGIVDLAEGKKPGDGKLATGSMMAWVDPRAEWLQMFNEAWRLERDFYYDPGMGGLDWKAVGERYRQLVPYVAHRADLNYILGELIGELATSHTYVGGGDYPSVPRVGTGLLGVDWSLDAASGLYRLSRIYRARDWNSDVAAPLGEPGLAVREGDFLLSVNGRPVRSPQNVYEAFVGTVGKQTVLQLGASANDPKPRTVTVKPIANEATLRYTAWVRSNWEKVQKATGGRVAYIHVPNTAVGGIQEFSKGYYPQVDKQGIIVDERFNGGGFIPDFFVERLMRKTWSLWSSRDGESFRTPGQSIDGPKCILANEYAGSGGDCFPFYFRQQGVGPIIGKRTWGGLVGISRDLPLMDGGAVTMPDFGIYGMDGKWMIENHGVDPDIEVENTPESGVDGRDLQLEKAIEWTLDQLKQHPVVRPPHPAYKKQ